MLILQSTIHTSIISIGLVVACIAFVQSECFAQTGKQNRTVSALRLAQRHNYWGDMETIVAEQGVRINNKGRWGYSLVAKKPDWKVTVFRDDDKTYHSRELKQFLQGGIVSDMMVKKQNRVTPPGGLETTRKLGDALVKDIRRQRSEYSYLPLKGIAAPQVESILYEALKVTTNGGIPLRQYKIVQGGVDWMTGLNSAGDERMLLNTRKIERVKVPISTFDAPSGYSMSKSVQEVLLSKKGRDASGDFDEMFEIGKPGRH